MLDATGAPARPWLTGAELHVRLIHSTAGVPQGRGKLERLFGTINTELLAGLPGQLPPGSSRPVIPPALSLAQLVLAHHWHRLGLTLDLEDFTDAETIAGITTGNFRLLHRLLAQTERSLEINHLHTITAEVVDAARETLVIGA